jgi:hypothetical protein
LTSVRGIGYNRVITKRQQCLPRERSKMKQENKDGLKKIAIGFGVAIGGVLLLALPQPAQGMGSGSEFVSDWMGNTEDVLSVVCDPFGIDEDC